MRRFRFQRTDVLVRDNVVEQAGQCACCGKPVSCPVGPVSYVQGPAMGQEQPLCEECLKDISPSLGDMYTSWDPIGANTMGRTQQWGPKEVFDPTS